MPDELREWQKPLTPEKTAWLVERFAAAKARIEAYWGTSYKPWQERSGGQG